MELDITIHRGKSNAPLIVLIHGLGMDKNIWLNPLDTKVLAKNVPLKIFAAKIPKPLQPDKKNIKKISFGDIPGEIHTLWDALIKEGFNIICWSQRRPVGPISAAVQDLEEVMETAQALFPKNPIAFVCHSRGGLIARKFMEKRRPEIKALITIATPNSGSAISNIGRYIAPLYAVFKGILPKSTHGDLADIIKNTGELLEGKAIKELMPDSDFFRSLKDSPQRGVYYISFGGTEPKVLTVYRWEERDGKILPKELFSIPDSLSKVLPPSLQLDEITPGKGDVLVSAKSSLLPWSPAHYDLPANHLSIMWHKEVIEKTIEVLRNI